MYYFFLLLAGLNWVFVVVFWLSLLATLYWLFSKNEEIEDLIPSTRRFHTKVVASICLVSLTLWLLVPSEWVNSNLTEIREKSRIEQIKKDGLQTREGLKPYFPKYQSRKD